MTSRFATHHRTHSPDVVDLARQLLGAAPHERSRCSRSLPRPDRTDVDELLLDTAAGVLAQLRVLGELCRVPADRDRVVVEIYATAETHEVAPIGAIGVTCMLAELLQEPCEIELASTLVRARNAFSDQELLDGAAAMCAATSWHLGDRLGIDPLDVIGEVYSQRDESLGTALHRCRKHHRSI